MTRNAAFILIAVAFISLPARAEDAVRITVFHTNDIHGWIFPRSSERNPKKMIGGMAALAGVIRKETGHKLVLDAGDWFTGTPEGGLNQGAEAAEFFNAVNYDAVEIGNHDYDNGEEPLKRVIGKLKMPALGANVYSQAAGKRAAYLTPSLIKGIGGVKVGIFGLVTSHMSELVFPEHVAGLRFRREADEARDQVAELKKKGATVIIAVTHVGLEDAMSPQYEGDRFIASHVDGIDLIVGGHSHTAIEPPVRDPVHGTLIVQTGKYLANAGKVVLTIDPKTKRVRDSSGELIPLWIDEAGQADDIAALVARYRTETDRIYNVVLATSSVSLMRGPTASVESTLGDWMSDCFRESAHADIALMNPHGIRSDLPAGPVTFREIYQVMPFENSLLTITLTGKQVRDLLEYGVSGKAGLVQLSGARLHYHSGAPGRRIETANVNGALLNDSKTYTVAVSDFLLSGGDGYTILAQGKGRISTGRLMRDVLASCAKDRPIQALPADRVVEDK